jgi:hypothetical protein
MHYFAYFADDGACKIEMRIRRTFRTCQRLIESTIRRHHLAGITQPERSEQDPKFTPDSAAGLNLRAYYRRSKIMNMLFSTIFTIFDRSSWYQLKR